MAKVGSTDHDFCMVSAQAMHPEAGPIVASMIHYFGPKSAEEKAQFIAPLRTLEPIADHVGQLSYAQTQDSMTGPLDAMPPVHVYWVTNKLQVGGWLRGSAESVLDCFSSLWISISFLDAAFIFSGIS